MTKRIAFLLSALLFALVLPLAAHAAVNYARLSADSSTPTGYVNTDVQMGTTNTITQASTETTVLDLPAAIAADHGGTVCKHSYNRTRIFTLYTNCVRVRCTFGDGSPMQQAQACVSDLQSVGSSQHASITLTSGSDSITLNADAEVVSY